MRLWRRLAACAAVLALVVAPAAGAQDYPTRTVRLVVPSPGGSTTDTLARLLADELGQKWGTSVVVENVSRGLVVGATQVFRAVPDGYTLLVSPPAPITFNHLLYRDLGYDPFQFVPVALLAKVANVLAVRKDLPARSVGELIALAKARPGQLTYGSQGVGSTAHLSATLLQQMTGIAMVHVPYRGAMPALNDVIAGHIDIFFDTLTTSVPMYRSDALRILAVGSPQRARSAPELPTLDEAGLTGFRSITWFAVVAPPATPAALAERINRDIADCLTRQEVAARLETLSLEAMIGAPAAAAKFIADEAKLWGKVITAANIRME